MGFRARHAEGEERLQSGILVEAGRAATGAGAGCGFGDWGVIRRFLLRTGLEALGCRLLGPIQMRKSTSAKQKHDMPIRNQSKPAMLAGFIESAIKVKKNQWWRWLGASEGAGAFFLSPGPLVICLCVRQSISSPCVDRVARPLSHSGKTLWWLTFVPGTPARRAINCHD